MPRYFFDVCDGQIYGDGEGSELPDDEAACRQAVAAAGELLLGRRGSPDDWCRNEWRLDVTDERSRRVASLRFSVTFHDEERAVTPSARGNDQGT